MAESKNDQKVQPGSKILPWQTLAVEKVADCRIFTVQGITRRSPSSDRTGEFFVVDTRDWVNILAITDTDEVILIRQYRHGTDEITLEIPGGIIDAGETPEEAGRRELKEETGYDCADIRVIGRVRSNPAFITNWTYTVLATGLTVGHTELEEHEEITVDTFPVGRIDELLTSGAITHALVLNAFQWYRLHVGSTPDKG